MDHPGFFGRQRILYASQSDETATTGDGFLDAGHLDDALDCYFQSGQPAKIDRIAEAAAEAGDPFILMRIEKHRGAALGEGAWDRAIARAEEAGKLSLAALARRYLATRAFS